MAHGWTRREAGWLALVCLHSGVFFRSRYLAFIGRTNPALANRFIRRCRKVADAIRLLLLRVADEKRLPFTVRAPNAATVKAIEELDEGKRFSNAEDLFKDLGV